MTRMRPDPSPPHSRPPWRRITALTMLVMLVLLGHLALLGLIQAGQAMPPLPLANKFITRTIEIAPPAAAMADPQVAAPESPAPATRRPVRRTRPIQREPAHASLAASAQAEPDPLPSTPAPASTAGETTAAAQDNGSVEQSRDAGTPSESKKSGHDGRTDTPPGTPGATHPLRLYGSMRMAFDLHFLKGGIQPYSGFGELLWLQDGQEYNAQLTVQQAVFTLLRWTSVGRIDASGIAPTRFSEKRFRRPEVASHFERDEHMVIFSNNKPRVPLQAGAQDRLSVLVQLGAILAGDPARYPPGSRISIQTVGPNNGDTWVFDIGEDEVVPTPAGPFNARHINRMPRTDDDYQFDLWLSPERGYLPVQMRLIQRNGDIYEFNLRNVSAP